MMVRWMFALLAALPMAAVASTVPLTDLDLAVQPALRALEAGLAADLNLEQVQVRLAAPGLKAALPPGTVTAVWRATPQRAYRQRLAPWIEFRVDGRPLRTLAVPVQVSAQRRVLQASRAIGVGEAVSTDNTQAVLQDAATSGAALAAADWQPSHQATAPVPQGAVLQRHQVADPALSVRGTQVPVRVQVAGVQVQAQGVLLDDAREGQTARIRLPRAPGAVLARRVDGQFVLTPSPADAGEGWGEGRGLGGAGTVGDKTQCPSPQPSPADAGEGVGRFASPADAGEGVNQCNPIGASR